MSHRDLFNKKLNGQLLDRISGQRKLWEEERKLVARSNEKQSNQNLQYIDESNKPGVNILINRNAVISVIKAR